MSNPCAHALGLPQPSMEGRRRGSERRHLERVLHLVYTRRSALWASWCYTQPLAERDLSRLSQGIRTGLLHPAHAVLHSVCPRGADTRAAPTSLGKD